MWIVPAAVIFDFDGVILDSETPEFESHRRIYEQCGAELTREEWCDQIGIWSDGTRGALARGRCASARRGRSTATPSSARSGASFRSSCRANRCAASASCSSALRRRRHSARDRLVRTRRAGSCRRVDGLGLTPLFGAIVTGDDVVRRKPAPDGYLEAARRLGADPARSMAIEDSGPGIVAARAAGMKTVAIPHPLTEGHDLTGADLRVAHAGELTVARLATLLA